MKLVVTICIAALLALSVVAWQLTPSDDNGGRTKIIWCTDDNPARREQIKLFERLYPQYDLVLDPSNYSTEKIIVQSIAGVGPDVFDSFGASLLDIYVKAGICWDVTDELAKAGIDAKPLTWNVSHDSFIRNGRIYGFPTNAGVRVILYNKDLFDKYGVPYPPKGPWKWEQFVPIAKKLTIRDERGRVKQYGFMFSWWHWEMFVRQWGGSLFTPDGTRCTADSPECVAATQFMHDLVYKHRVAPTPLEESAMATQGGWGTGDINIFASGRVAMVIGDRYWLCSLRNNKTFRMGVAECPYEKVRVFLGGSRVSLINRNSPRKKAALTFLKYLTSKEYNKLLNHQADWLAPVKHYCYTPEYEHDPDFPDEDFNDVFRAAMDHGSTSQFSKFASAQVVWRIVNRQLELVRANHKSPKTAMRTIARQVNAAIREQIEIDPSLRKEYLKQKAMSARRSI